MAHYETFGVRSMNERIRFPIGLGAYTPPGTAGTISSIDPRKSIEITLDNGFVIVVDWVDVRKLDFIQGEALIKSGRTKDVKDEQR